MTKNRPNPYPCQGLIFVDQRSASLAGRNLYWCTSGHWHVSEYWGSIIKGAEYGWDAAVNALRFEDGSLPSIVVDNNPYRRGCGS